MKKTSLIITAIILSILGIFLFTQYNHLRSFELISPKKGDITEAIYGLGTVNSHKFYEFKSAIPMTVEKIFVKEGDHVEADQRLLSLSSGQIRKAPFAGTVTELPVHETENVPPNFVIIQIQDLKDRYIEVSLEQEGALRVKEGQKCRIMFESLRGHHFEGAVSAFFPRRNEFLVHINVSNLDDNILPGMTADVSIEIGKKENVLLIPVSSIDSGMVSIKRDGKKMKVKLKIGHVQGNWAEVVEGDISLEDEIYVPKLHKE
ncbi:MAG: efflux RND transporter periplasmic adaptor subunit [Halobacteriovoraceae bacterium]|nr:efflux RND transporter periplasmic adaptor subunit [Halobacteriovoraceae bacterium]MCB9093882.1 efflux RND transporter periplasmic adaptor subunit [Halobacteriovoraceae bacterium]